MIVAVVVDDFAVHAHVLDSAIFVHDDVVVRLLVGHAAREDVGGAVVILVPVHELPADIAQASVVLIVLSHDNSFWSRAENRILRKVERLKSNGFGRNAGLCDCKS